MDDSRDVTDEAARDRSGRGPARTELVQRQQVIDYVLSLGATEEEVESAVSIGELALNLHMRPRTGLTLRDVIEAEDIEWARARRFLAAAGLPTDPDAQITGAEADAVRLLTMVTTEFLGDEAALQIARVAGTAMARVAESVVTAFRLQFEVPQLTSGVPYLDVVKEYMRITDLVLPPFVGMLDVLMRRQILMVAEWMWSTDDERTTVTLPRTVGFVDLVGYTTAAATMSERELTEVLVAFDEVVSEAVLEGGGQVVKTIGDEALFVTEQPAAACRIALRLVERIVSSPLPQVRVGLADGKVVSVFGDVYGPEVNLAARLVGAASPSTVYVSDAVRERCAGEFTFEPLGVLTLKGFPAPVSAHRLVE